MRGFGEFGHSRHQAPVRIVCERIDIENYGNQRTVLTVPVSKLYWDTFYDLAIRQPIPFDARGLPLYLKAVADLDFVPNVSVGHGRTDEMHWEREGDFANTGRHGNHGGHGDGDDVEVITETVQAKMFRVQLGANLGNQAFGNALVGRDGEPFPIVRLYLNDVNEFMLLPPYPREARRCEPRRLIRRKEVIVREPIHADTLGIDRTYTEFVHPRRFETSELWVEGQIHGHRGRFPG